MEEKKTTRQKLDIAIKEANSILRWINEIVKALEEDALSLGDIVAEQESLENRCYELQEKLKEVVSLRQWLDFEEFENNDFRGGIF